MTAIDPDRTLGELVAERPALATAFERLRLDYCCGGGRTLAQECRQRGLDPETVAALLEQLAATDAAAAPAPHDLRGAALAELCDHIVADHHGRLRRELPQLAETLATVVRVHGAEHPELHDLQRLFRTLAGELLDHLQTEETALFPALRRVAAGEPATESLAALIAEHESEHSDTGDALAALRELANDYAPERAYCGTHRHLLESLAAFERDLHQHVHEENNLLFPRALAATTG